MDECYFSQILYLLKRTILLAKANNGSGNLIRYAHPNHQLLDCGTIEEGSVNRSNFGG
jgi:hypothetical protein